MSSSRLNSAIRVLTGLIGLALFGYFMLFFVREYTKMSGWHHSGGLWSETQVVSDSLVIFSRVESTDFISGTIPHAGDTVTSVNDSAVTVARLNSYFDSLRAPGLEVPVEFLHAGTVERAMVRTRTPPQYVYVLEVILQALRFLIAGLSIGVGLWAFFARPDSAGVRALAFFGFAMGSFMIVGVQVNSSRHAAFAIPFMDQIHQALQFLMILFGAFWLNLQLLFPRPAKLMRDHPVWAYLICYAPLVIVALGMLAFAILKRPVQPVAAAGGIIILLQIVSGFVLLAFRYKRAQDRLERRQTRLVFLGSGIGLTLLVVMIIFIAVWGQTIPGGQIGLLILINVTFMALLLSPLSFAYAFGRYRLLEVEGKLRRGTRYLLTIALLIGLLLALAYIIGKYLQGNTVGTLILFLFAASLVPLTTYVKRQLEKWFYPERLRLRRMIRDFLEHALSIPDKETFWSELQLKLREGLRIDRVHPVLLISGNGHYSCMVLGATPFTTQSVFLERLARERRPVLVDEVIASAKVQLTPDEVEWFEVQRVGLVLPLVSHSSLIGFLGLGQKTEQEDYAAEELRILDSLSSQIAMASENIRLLEENIVKRQLEEQLQIARRIQQGFLPQEIPPTVGLEIAAGSRFCLDVAGDYYDVIPLDDGRTVLAVGDVSGKGAGAALLMANLQASLRTAVGMGNSLDNVVERVNDLIFRNTPPEQYITFFVGIFDSSDSSLTYVNAGHNPPLLIRNHGENRPLDIGGVILGFLPGMKYDQEQVFLTPGDLIIMYTDGVSEAMNSTEEEFGEARISSSVINQRAEPVQIILTSLEREVVTFRGSELFEDDFTLLLVRAT